MRVIEGFEYIIF